jgi:hypothetical protein
VPTDSTNPTPSAAEALPVELIRYRPTGVDLMTTDDDGPWCRFGLAQAIIERLTRERDVAWGEAADIRQAWNDAEDEMAAQKVDVEAVMRLADAWAVATGFAMLAANTGKTSEYNPDAAREALRAALEGRTAK